MHRAARKEEEVPAARAAPVLRRPRSRCPRARSCPRASAYLPITWCVRRARSSARALMARDARSAVRSPRLSAAWRAVLESARAEPPSPRRATRRCRRSRFSINCRGRAWGRPPRDIAASPRRGLSRNGARACCSRHGAPRPLYDGVARASLQRVARGREGAPAPATWAPAARGACAIVLVIDEPGDAPAARRARRCSRGSRLVQLVRRRRVLVLLARAGRRARPRRARRARRPWSGRRRARARIDSPAACRARREPPKRWTDGSRATRPPLVRAPARAIDRGSHVVSDDALRTCERRRPSPPATRAGSAQAADAYSRRRRSSSGGARRERTLRKRRRRRACDRRRRSPCRDRRGGARVVGASRRSPAATAKARCRGPNDVDGGDGDVCAQKKLAALRLHRGMRWAPPVAAMIPTTRRVDASSSPPGRRRRAVVNAQAKRCASSRRRSRDAGSSRRRSARSGEGRARAPRPRAPRRVAARTFAQRDRARPSPSRRAIGRGARPSAGRRRRWRRLAAFGPMGRPVAEASETERDAWCGSGRRRIGRRVG